MSCSPNSQSPVEPQALWDWPLQAASGAAKVHNDINTFEVHLNAQNFIPTEIRVKVIGNLIDIHAEHKGNPGSQVDIAKNLNRSYKLPEDVNAGSIKSWLSPRGYLVIKAAKKPQGANAQRRFSTAF